MGETTAKGTEPVPRRDGTITLADGRRLGYAEYGTEGGDAVLWFHGTPGARHQISPEVNAIADARGVRVITVERPGVGDSTPHLHGRILDWAGDIDQLTAQLEVDRFAIAGLSGGGPYVLACAHAFPDRVVAGAVLGGVAPTQGEDAAEGGLVALANRFRLPLEWLRQPLGYTLWGAVNLLMPFQEQAVGAYLHFQPPGDQEVFKRPGMKEMFLKDIATGSRKHFHAVIYDVVLFTRDWGFSPREVRVPIRFWHGDEDHIVPLVHGHHVASLMPDAEVFERPGESHLGALAVLDEVLDVLLGLWPDRTNAPARVAARKAATKKAPAKKKATAKKAVPKKVPAKKAAAKKAAAKKATAK
ncbi:MAG: alpha/beta hydrolase [Acidimicrobiales bacterium]|nr:alpha/beta hydrolase [Acidimicrobiales bacterium]